MMAQARVQIRQPRATGLANSTIGRRRPLAAESDAAQTRERLMESTGLAGYRTSTSRAAIWSMQLVHIALPITQALLVAEGLDFVRGLVEQEIRKQIAGQHLGYVAGELTCLSLYPIRSGLIGKWSPLPTPIRSSARR